LGRETISIPQKRRKKRDGKRDIDGNHRNGWLNKNIMSEGK